MLATCSLKEVLDSLDTYHEKYGDMAVTFLDKNGEMHAVHGCSLGEFAGEKGVILRGFGMDNLPANLLSEQ